MSLSRATLVPRTSRLKVFAIILIAEVQFLLVKPALGVVPLSSPSMAIPSPLDKVLVYKKSANIIWYSQSSRLSVGLGL